MEGEIVRPFLILTRNFLSVFWCDFCCFAVDITAAMLVNRNQTLFKLLFFWQPTGPSCLEFAKKEIAFVFVGHVHVAAAWKRSHQWCISLTPNNTKTVGRMTCLCFLRPIRSTSYATRIYCCHSLFHPIMVSFAAAVSLSVFLIRPLHRLFLRLVLTSFQVTGPGRCSLVTKDDNHDRKDLKDWGWLWSQGVTGLTEMTKDDWSY